MQGGRLPVRIRLVDVPGFVVLKAHAFEDRQAPKDAYDLCYVLAYAKEGPAAIADRLARHAGDSEVARAVDCLRTAFASPDTAGSVAVAVFEEAQGEEAEQQAALAAYSDDADHRFRQADRRFRFMPITLEERRSIAGRGVGVEG
ncbi:hypothetical protein [Candidatus Palauibacter sp.]|uniref:hypothetical protein n=1 Tax=Candidatus Palauibacter sp. TaxID=3101350 RepID=UPI003B5C1901